MAPTAKPLVVTPSAPAGKWPGVAADPKKKAKSTTALVIQDAITKMSYIYCYFFYIELWTLLIFLSFVAMFLKNQDSGDDTKPW